MQRCLSAGFPVFGERGSLPRCASPTTLPLPNYVIRFFPNPDYLHHAGKICTGFPKSRDTRGGGVLVASFPFLDGSSLPGCKAVARCGSLPAPRRKQPRRGETRQPADGTRCSRMKSSLKRSGCFLPAAIASQARSRTSPSRR